MSPMGAGRLKRMGHGLVAAENIPAAITNEVERKGRPTWNREPPVYSVVSVVDAVRSSSPKQERAQQECRGRRHERNRHFRSR